MSTVGQWVGGIVGAVIGYYTIGVAQGAAIGMALGGALDPPKGPHMEGPRLSDLSVQTSAYGVPIPRFKGKIATYGNVFWVKGNKIDETVTEDNGGKGGGGPTSTSYSYSATFAVGLGEGPITGIGRIWIRSKLVYDGTSLDPATISAGFSTDQFTFYSGSDTQMPDPTIQADRGVANTPAYRGLAYIVFHNLQLADYSNSLAGAQVKVEVIANGGITSILEVQDVIDTQLLPINISVYGSYAYILNFDSHTLQVFNISDPTNIFLVSTTNTRAVINGGYNPSSIAISDNIAYVTAAYYGFLLIYDISTPSLPNLISYIDVSQSYAISVKGGFAYLFSVNSFQVVDVSDIYKPRIAYSTTTNYTAYRTRIFENNLYVAGYNTNKLLIYDISDPYLPLLLSETTTGNGPKGIAIHGNYAYVGTYISKTLEIYDISTLSSPVLKNTIQTVGDLTGVEISYDRLFISSFTNTFIKVYNITDPLNPILVNTTNPGPVTSMEVVGRYAYALIGNAENYLRSVFFADNIISGISPQLSSIVESECLMSNLLTAGDIDVTELTDVVRGYKISNVAAIRASLETLRGAYPFDVVQHGYKLKFKRRGSSSVATIPWDQLDARKSGDKPGVRITSSREMDSILPAKVTVKHFDIDREYDQGEQFAERINTDAVNVRTIEMPLSFNATEAANKADMLLYLYWLERYDVTLTLPPTYQNLEPGDTITVTGDETTYLLRLTSVNSLPDGRMECAAKYAATSVYSPVAVGESGQQTGVTLSLPGSTVYELLDIPTLSDAYNLTGFPVAMSGFLAGWPGGTLVRSSDLQTWTAIQGFVAPGCRLGFASTALGAHDGRLIDKGGSLAVRIYRGSLSSITEGQMLNGGNHFAYGLDGRWEIIAAQNCTLQGDGTYILTDFLRGRFGTEWATGLHVAGDHLVLLNQTDLQFVAMDTNSIGASRYYRGITQGKDISTDQDRSFAYQGVNLECLSPIYLNGNRTANDWNLTWLRRTRVGGEWRDLVDATLGEATESYEVDIFSDGTYTTKKRTLAVTTAAAVYTSANQITDFGANQSTLYLKIYQLSATVGRGYPLTTSITR